MTKKTYNVVILGATGRVGKEFLSILEQRNFPINQLYLLGSERSAGKRLRFAGQSYTVQDATKFDFKQAEIGLFSAGGSVSAKYAPLAAKAGCVVIDNTSHFRYDSDVPLVVPEVNVQAIGQYRQRNIIANPNCSTIQLVVALKSIYDKVGISRINIATYQSVSGAGQVGIAALDRQSHAFLKKKADSAATDLWPIAFNVVPHIDEFQDNGYTREEMKLVWETRKLFNNNALQVNATAVRVPVFYGHAEAVHIETRAKITTAQACELLRTAPGIKLMEDNTYPTPLLQGMGSDSVFVGRVREDISHPLGLNLWIVADNVRKGAALNAVQIAEVLIAEYL